MSARLRDTKNNGLPGPSARERLFYAKLMGATDLKDFTKKIQAELHRLDITDFVLQQMSKRRPYALLISSLPKALLMAYQDHALYQHDLTLDYLEHNGTPFYQSLCHEHCEITPMATPQTETMRALFKLNSRYGIFDVYHIPYKASHGRDDRVFSVTIKGVNPIDFKSAIRGKEQTLKLLAQAIDAAGTRRFPQPFDSHKRKVKTELTHTLNPKSLQVLATMANGDFEIRQVAKKLGLSEVTVHVHLGSARRSLGVRTTHAAIRKCVVAGLIEYEEDSEPLVQLSELSK